jgi:hypothetical protein
MNSLYELKDFFKSKEIQVKEYNGWQLKVGKDVWTLANDVFYLNGKPQSLKDKLFINEYMRNKSNVESKSTKVVKWRGISSRNYR